jgi:MoxR-like ATPase
MKPAEARALADRIRASVHTGVVGRNDAVEQVLTGIVADGHLLLEDLPGLGKTLLAKSFAQALGLEFQRIQFTADLLPHDITGGEVLTAGGTGFEFRPGPLFTNVLLADEINRAPPKVQSALLEAMQERQVTIEGTSHPLPRPFVVIATQNPIEQEGTYPLPEAELDRFLFRWIVRYPSAEDEVTILKTRSAADDAPASAAPAVGPAELDRLATLHQEVFLTDDLFRYLAGVVRKTRDDHRLLLGASPRASVQFLRAARASALLDGRDFVVPDDIRELAFAVLNHRVILRPEALSPTSGLAEPVGAIAQLERVLKDDLDAVEVPR